MRLTSFTPSLMVGVLTSACSAGWAAVCWAAGVCVDGAAGGVAGCCADIAAAGSAAASTRPKSRSPRRCPEGTHFVAGVEKSCLVIASSFYQPRPPNRIRPNPFKLSVVTGGRCLAIQPAQEPLQLLRQRRLQLQQLARRRVRELEPRGVKKVPSQPEPFRLRLAPRGLGGCGLRGSLVRQLPRAPVERVPHHRVPDRRHVDSNLMRPAGLDAHPNQRELAKAIVEPPHHLRVRKLLSS